MMYHTVYKTIRTSTGEYYIGVHSTTNLNDRYMGSGDRIKHIISKYGKADLKRVILHMCDTRREALLIEHTLLSIDVLSDPLCLNVAVGGKGNPEGGHGITKEAKHKLSVLHMGRSKSVETKQRISESKRGVPSRLKGRARPLEVIQKIAAANTGKPKSEEHKAKISATTMGRKRPLEVCAKIALASAKRRHTEETKEKLRNRPKIVVTCPHCGRTGALATMSRWHFNKCSVLQRSLPVV
jgi:predicted GIY-YIG superfamily endonuclease